MASVWFWWHFHSFCFLKLLFAEKYSRCSNSLNFEAKINCNTFKPNVPKWRKTCTGLQFDVVHFNGPQSHLLSGGNLWGPCMIMQTRWTFWPCAGAGAPPPPSGHADDSPRGHACSSPLQHQTSQYHRSSLQDYHPHLQMSHERLITAIVGWTSVFSPCVDGTKELE